MATVYGNTINGYWRVYLTYTLNNDYSATHASIAWSYGINWVKDVKGNDSANNYSSSNDRPTYVACTGQTTQYRYPTATFTKDNSWAGRSIMYGSGTYYIPKKTTEKGLFLYLMSDCIFLNEYRIRALSYRYRYLSKCGWLRKIKNIYWK